MRATILISLWQCGHRSGSASQTFWMSSRHLLEGIRRGLYAEDVDDLAFGHGHGSGIRLPEPLAAQLIGIPSVIANELEAFVRDVLGDAGDEVAGAKHFKIALDLGVHPRAVNDRVAGAVGLAAPCPRGCGAARAAAVDVEPRMPPATQHVRSFGRQKPLLDQERDDPCTEEFLQRREAHVDKIEDDDDVQAVVTNLA